MDYKIISDGCCDLEKEIIEQYNLRIIPFYISFDEETYYKEIEEIGIREVYERMVGNPDVYPKTSLPSVQNYIDVFTEYVKEGTKVSEKIIFNFFDDSIEDNIQKLVDYFRLEKDKVIEYISSFDNPADITVENFIVEFGINLTNFDCANVDIVCRHMTVLTEEGLEDVKTKGLLDLVGVLTEDTVLKRFLYENQVVFDVQGKRLIVDGQDYVITTSDDSCLFCIENKEIRCGVFERCDIREKMDFVGRKLYELGGTLEFFVSGTKEDMERYSVIHLNPEILETLDQLLGKIKVKTNRKLPYALSYKWREQEKKTYILQFAVNMSEVEAYCVCNYERAYYNYEEILEYSGYTHSDYLMNKIPERVYQNMKIIDWFLAACLCKACEFGSLLPGKIAEPSKMEVFLEYE